MHIWREHLKVGVFKETVSPGPICVSFTKSPAHPNSKGAGGLKLMPDCFLTVG
jgi:hypothetical protein